MGRPGVPHGEAFDPADFDLTTVEGVFSALSSRRLYE